MGGVSGVEQRVGRVHVNLWVTSKPERVRVSIDASAQRESSRCAPTSHGGAALVRCRLLVVGGEIRVEISALVSDRATYDEGAPLTSMMEGPLPQAVGGWHEPGMHRTSSGPVARCAHPPHPFPLNSVWALWAKLAQDSADLYMRLTKRLNESLMRLLWSMRAVQHAGLRCSAAVSCELLALGFGFRMRVDVLVV